MIAIIEEKTFKLHQMDNSRQGYRIVLKMNDHRMIIRNRWESCGVIQEIVSCSCGLMSTEHQGGGCWQMGHDKPRSHREFSEVHINMYQEAIKE